jgi:hypothetical protein
MSAASAAPLASNNGTPRRIKHQKMFMGAAAGGAPESTPIAGSLRRPGGGHVSIRVEMKVPMQALLACSLSQSGRRLPVKARLLDQKNQAPAPIEVAGIDSLDIVQHAWVHLRPRLLHTLRRPSLSVRQTKVPRSARQADTLRCVGMLRTVFRRSLLLGRLSRQFGRFPLQVYLWRFCTALACADVALERK